MAVDSVGDAAGGADRRRAGSAAPSAAGRGAARVRLFVSADAVRHDAVAAPGADGHSPRRRVREPRRPNPGALADPPAADRDPSRTGWKPAARVLATADRRALAVGRGV